MNWLQTGLAFSEGLALIASPCILPVLPLVLSASAEGGRKRPFGIILGFVLSFTLFALASRKLVAFFHINPDVIRNVSLILLLVFGVTLLSGWLSEKFSSITQGAANFGANLSASGKEGLMSGILIGALIGLIWTPCAGPILAAVLVQVIREQSDTAGSIIIAAFAVGAGIPMLVIALMGRKIMSKLGFFTKHSEAVRKIFGVIIILSVLFIASGIDVQSLFTPAPQATHADDTHLLAKPYAAPEFAGIDAWINSKPLTMKGLKGKVVLVDFWTYSCINCVRTLPYITTWDAKYRDKGLVIVGVSSPEFEFEKNPDNVKAAVINRGIKYPVALDNHLATWVNFNNRYWPAHYLIDRNGNVVYIHYGEGEYDETENIIRSLLGIKDKVENTAPAPVAGNDQTHETYLGSARATNFSSAPTSLALHHWALSGAWKIGPEHITTAEAGAALRLHFKAKKVFLVLGTATGKPISASVTLNGLDVGNDAGKDAHEGKLTVNRNTLYELIDLKKNTSGELEIKAGEPGLEAYAFTFGE